MRGVELMLSGELDFRHAFTAARDANWTAYNEQDISIHALKRYNTAQPRKSWSMWVQLLAEERSDADQRRDVG